MMSYAEFLLRQRASAMRQLLLVSAVRLAQANSEDLASAAALTQLRTAAGA